MRAPRARPPPRRPALGRVVLALAASLLAHGAVLAAVLLAPAASPPEPLPALLVELVREAGGSASEAPSSDGAPGGTVAAPEAAAADLRPSAAEPETPRPPMPAPATATERPPRGAARPAPERPAAPAPRPMRVATPAAAERSVPVGAPTVAAGTEGGSEDRGRPAGRGGPGSAVDGPVGDAPPGFATGSAQNPLPRYPTAARRRGVEGTVTLEVVVGADGLVHAVEIARSSGSGLLDEAALEAVRGWRFRPARRGGEPVEGRVSVPIAFRLVEPGHASLP